MASEHKMKNGGGEEWIKEAQLFMEENLKEKQGIPCAKICHWNITSHSSSSVSHPDCALYRNNSWIRHTLASQPSQFAGTDEQFSSSS